MSSIAESLNKRGNAWGIALAGLAALIVVAVSVPTLNRSRMVANQAREYAMQVPVTRGYQSESYEGRLHSAALASVSTALVGPAAPMAGVDSAMDRKMVRTIAFDLVVRKPAEAAEKIRALAESMGGFLVSSEVSGGQDAGGGLLTVRVPAGRLKSCPSRSW